MAPRDTRLRFVRHLVRALAITGLLLRSSGCASRPLPSPPPVPPPVAPLAVAPPETPAVATAPDDPLAVMLIVPRLPPPSQPEVPGERPGPAQVWVPGFWAWRGDDYEWVAGTWEVPPTPSSVWVPSCWVREGEGYRCFTGHWR